MSGGSKSGCEGCALSEYLKNVLFSTTNAASATIDFFKRNVDNGVVDSPPNGEPPRSPIVVASPMQRSPSVLCWHRSLLPCQGPTRTLH